MTKVESFFTLQGMVLSNTSEIPLYKQLYERTRDAILESKLKPGVRIPPTRILAKDLKISRNTVVCAFDQLIAEGYIEGKVGVGSFVSTALPEELLQLRVKHYHSKKVRNRSLSSLLSSRGKSIDHIQIPTGFSSPVPFRTGVPALDQFPFKIWKKISGRRWSKPSSKLLCYGYGGGYRPLCEAISSYLGATRGVRCQPEQVIIVNGAQQAFYLIAHLLTDPGDEILMEDPSYPNAQRAFLAEQLNPVPVRVDENGMKLDQNIIEICSRPKIIYTTPSYQFPLGIRMSLARRIHLLELARKSNLWILEDDYDSEYRYDGLPISALQGLDQSGKVIYIGTFSKVLFPSLRIGYLIVPQDLIDSFTKALIIYNRGVPVMNQAILADFITEGHFARHIRKMRLLYAQRQMALVNAINQRFEGMIDISQSDAGLHLIGWMSKMDDKEISEKLMHYGIVAPSVSTYSMGTSDQNGLILGYAGLTPQQINTGVEQMEKAILH